MSTYLRAMKGVPLGRASRYAVTFGGAGAVLSTVPLPSQGSITRRDPATYVPGPNEELVTFANTQDAGFGSRIVHYDFADAWDGRVMGTPSMQTDGSKFWVHWDVPVTFRMYVTREAPAVAPGPSPAVQQLRNEVLGAAAEGQTTTGESLADLGMIVPVVRPESGATGGAAKRPGLGAVALVLGLGAVAWLWLKSRGRRR